MSMDNESILSNTSYGNDFNFSVYGIKNLPEWARITQIVYLAIVMVIGVPGNGLLILVQAKNRNKSSTDCSVLTMAILELICSAFSTTLNMFRNSATVWKQMASDGLCKGLVFIAFVIGFASLCLLANIAIDRYIKTCCPLSITYSVRRAKIICVWIVIINSVLSSPTLATFELDQTLNCNHNSSFMSTYQRILAIVSIFIIVSILISYIKVVLAIRKRYAQRMNTKLGVINVSHGASSSISRYLKFKWPKRPKTFPADEGNQKNMPTESKINAGIRTTTSSQPASMAILVKLRNDERLVNKTTRTVFFITFTYVLLFLFQWILILPDDSLWGAISWYFASTVRLLNCITNPLFIFGFHSKFRREVQIFVFGRR